MYLITEIETLRYYLSMCLSVCLSTFLPTYLSRITEFNWDLCLSVSLDLSVYEINNWRQWHLLDLRIPKVAIVHQGDVESHESLPSLSLTADRLHAVQAYCMQSQLLSGHDWTCWVMLGSKSFTTLPPFSSSYILSTVPLYPLWRSMSLMGKV